MTDKPATAPTTCPDCKVINTAPYGVELCPRHASVDDLMLTLAAMTRELDETINVTTRAIEQCERNFETRVAPSIKAVKQARELLDRVTS